METLIFHITQKADWYAALQHQEYTAPSLQTEGFIHCSTTRQLVKVANAFYVGQDDLAILCIAPNKLKSKVLWEPPAHLDANNPPDTDDTELFPHIYGSVNIDAVVEIVDFPANEDGIFTLPPKLYE